MLKVFSVQKLLQPPLFWLFPNCGRINSTETETKPSFCWIDIWQSICQYWLLYYTITILPVLGRGVKDAFMPEIKNSFGFINEAKWMVQEVRRWIKWNSRRKVQGINFMEHNANTRLITFSENRLGLPKIFDPSKK